MSFGARGSARNFGLASGLALPQTAQREHFATSGQAFMPQEENGKNNEFAVEHEEERKKRSSIAERIRNWFKKRQKSSRPDYESSTFPRRPNSAQLATIPEQSEDDGDKGEKVDGNAPADAPAEAAERSVDDGVVLRNKQRYQDRTRAYSTAFEHTSPTAQAIPTIDKVHLTIRNATSGLRKVVLQRSPTIDSFGFHLSGGQPPITITYVKPGSVADKKGIQLGDILLDLNGINCRKRVEISELMKMKFMFQQPQKPNAEEQSPGGIVKTKVTVTNVKKRDPNAHQKIGDPLATSSPIKTSEYPAETEQKPKQETLTNGSKKEKKRKKSKEEQQDEAKGTEAATAPLSSSEVESKSDNLQEKPKSKKKKRKGNGSSSVSEAEHIADDRKKGAKKKKKRLSAIDNEENGDTRAVLDLEPVLSVDVEPTTSHSVPKEDTSERDVSVEKQQRAAEDEEELNLQRKGRTRRSKSPKSRYHMDDSEVAVEGEDDGEAKTTKKKKKVARSSSGAEKDKKKKKKADKSLLSEETDKDKADQGASGEGKEKKKKKSTPSKKASKKAVSKSSEQEQAEESAEEPPDIPILSAAVSGSFESDTMEFVPKNKPSMSELNDDKDDIGARKNSLKKSKKKKKADDGDGRTHSLKRDKKKEKSTSQSQSFSAIRRASVDQGVVSSGKHSMSSSQSFSSSEEQKKFREELKEASKSEHNIAELASSIDSNIIVKKSGLVKGKSTSSSRPSIFNQSSSPEPEMTSMTSLTASETTDGDGLPDPDFKVKKSGKVVGRKTSMGLRPSILDEQSSAAYSDIQPGEMKYNKDVEIDLNSMPQIAPSLGLVAGRDRRDATNRSLTKRRPPSLRQNSQDKENESWSTTSRMAAAKKLFENKADQQESTSRFNGRSFSKSVEKPPKALSVPNEPTATATPTKNQDKPVPHPSNAWASNRAANAQSMVEKESEAPSWVSRAQKNRASVLETTSQPPKTGDTPPTSSPTSVNGIPSTGHVAARLAMFQK